MDNNLAQSEPAPDAPDLVTHPQLVKQQAAYIPGQDSVVSSDVPDHLGARAHADLSPFSSLGSGSGSSSNKLPRFSSGNDTTLVSASNTQSPDAIDDSPKIIESPDVLSTPDPALLVSEPPPKSKSSAAAQDPPAPTTSSSSPSSDSEGHVGPTRASIRAWAKATPSGPPRDTPSPHTALRSSGSDDNASRP
ncbi:hypothetical protein ONZ51_g12033 [Trametes cubensis]|uniref:Uncharacterized protein n=1 Tax=Trametes cubensis TaxID=1111947 RepID=A0AAD7X3R5_9APHY|nr:hypothetical protein ONZ51_g12033 [Trametes cubensis]